MTSKTEDRRTFNKIIWALNPFDRNPKLVEDMAKVLRNFDSIEGASIEPVFILSPAFYRSARLAKGSSISEHILIEMMRKTAKASGLKNIQAPVLLVEQNESHRSEVQRLLDYAKERKTSIIAVATHARKGLSRVMMGSFAETLLLHSSISLLFVNPSNRAPRKVSQIFFPTNLGKDSRKAFAWALDLTLELKARLTIFCSLPSAIVQGIRLANDIGAFPVLTTFDAEEVKKRTKTFLAFCEEAGVKARVISRASLSSIPDEIVKEAHRNKADLIAIAAREIPRMPMMVGSITRQVVRSATSPVFVYRPEI